jgi:hypothetical protein
MSVMTTHQLYNHEADISWESYALVTHLWIDNPGCNTLGESILQNVRSYLYDLWFIDFQLA